MATTTSGPARFRSFYGAGPLHLLGVLLALALAAYTLSVVGLSALWDPDVWWQSIVVWFLGAVIAHDLVLFPVYAGADRVLHLLVRRGARGPRPTRQDHGPGRSAVNYLRVPLLAVALLFLLFFPGMLHQGGDTYLRATGQTQDPFLRRWLLVSATIFAVAALAYAVRLVRLTRTTSAPPERRSPRAHDSGRT